MMNLFLLQRVYNLFFFKHLFMLAFFPFSFITHVEADSVRDAELLVRMANMMWLVSLDQSAAPRSRSGVN